MSVIWLVVIEKGKPFERVGRKATGPPKEESRVTITMMTKQTLLFLSLFLACSQVAQAKPTDFANNDKKDVMPAVGGSEMARAQEVLKTLNEKEKQPTVIEQLKEEIKEVKVAAKEAIQDFKHAINNLGAM